MRRGLVVLAVVGCAHTVTVRGVGTFEVWQRISIDTGGIAVASRGAADVPDRMIEINRDGIPAGEAVDLVYVIDTTNSMRDDIDEARRRMREILADLTAKNPDRRIGIVAYRDRGDDYIARTALALTPDDAAIEAGIASLTVAGGGDDREHVYAGLDLALREQPWRDGAARSIILMGDAPPHDDYQDDPRTYAATIALAREKAVKIHTIGVYAGGLDRAPAQATDEATLAPELRVKASINGKYAGLIATFLASEDVEQYGAYHDDGYWKGGTYKAPNQPAGYWVYVEPTWYIWARQVDGAPAGAGTGAGTGAATGATATPAAAHTCPTVPSLDDAQSTLAGMYGGTGYGGDGRARVVVVVEDYANLAPIADVPVHLSHSIRGPCTRDRGCAPDPTRPPDLDGKTDTAGRVALDVRDLDYQFTIPSHGKRGYLAYSSTYDLGAALCQPLVAQATKVDAGTRYFVTYLIPTSLLQITTRDQAIAAASAVPEIASWLGANPGYQITVQDGSPGPTTMWQVGWGDGKTYKRLVYVNAFDGSANVGGRWN